MRDDDTTPKTNIDIEQMDHDDYRRQFQTLRELAAILDFDPLKRARSDRFLDALEMLAEKARE